MNPTVDLDLVAPRVKGKTTTVTIHLTKNDTMADPSSTRRLIYGPATITVTRWADGGIDISVKKD